MSPARDERAPGDSRPPPPIQREELARIVHRALHHLYEPVELQISPLTRLLRLPVGVKGVDVAAGLRRALLDAIQELKPGPRAPLDSNAWRIYQVLTYRFEEQTGQDEVAAEIAVSPRQVRRLEHAAIEALVEILVVRYGVVVAGDEPAAPAAQPEGEAAPEGGREQELDWLKRSYLLESAEVAVLVQSALITSETLLFTCGCQVETYLPAGLPDVVGQATILRQALLNLILAAARTASGGRLTLRAGLETPNGSHVYIEVRGEGQPPSDAFNAGEHLEMAHRLLAISGGALELLPGAPSVENFAARALLPSAQPAAILVVDDNEDSLRLFERCLAGTRFHFFGERDPHQAIDRAGEITPRLVILDIMLPGIDGWELLGRLRAHPALGGIPVVISTILPHEELARSLGAAGFLRKPIDRENLLRLLDRLL